MKSANDRPPPDHRTPSAATVPYRTLWTATFLGYAAIGMTIQVIPAYAREHMGADALAAGLSVTIGSLATMVARPIAGRWADQCGGRPVVMMGSVLGLVGGLAHLVASTIALLVVARLVLGAGEGALFTAALGWVLSTAPAASRGRIAGHFGLSMWTGLAGGPVIGAAILTVGGYRSVWLAASILPAAAWLLIVCSRSSAPRALRSLDGRRTWFPRAAWVPGATMACASVGYGVIAAFLVPRFTFLGLPGQQFALGVFGAAFVLTRFFGSLVVDRWGASKVLALVLVIEAFGLFGLSTARGVLAVFFLIALTGAGISMLYPCLASLVTDAALPHERTSALGSMTAAWDLGLAVGGPLGGLVAGAANAAPFAVGAVAAMVPVVPLLIRRGMGASPRRSEKSRIRAE